MDPVLSFDSVDISYGNKIITRDISFALRPGEIVGIIGESGSGKSTILKAAMKILGGSGSVSKGNIFFKGMNILELSPKKMRQICGAQISMVFQDCRTSMCPVRTIGSQIYEIFLAHTKKSREEAYGMAFDLFEKLAFKDPKRILNSYPFELSGGMVQRVGIAMAMLLKPSVILADEPTSALDMAVQKQIINELLLLKDQYNIGIVFVSHNINIISKISDSMIVLKNGIVEEYGITSEVIRHPKSEYTNELIKAAPVLRR